MYRGRSRKGIREAYYRIKVYRGRSWKGMREAYCRIKVYRGRSRKGAVLQHPTIPSYNNTDMNLNTSNIVIYKQDEKFLRTNLNKSLQLIMIIN